MLIEAALEAGVRPTTMILGSDSRKKWSKLDVLIMTAYKMHVRERCQHCGGPIWICRNPDQRLQVRPKANICWVDQQVKDWRENTPKGIEDVEYVQPEMYSRDDSALHTFREPYYRTAAEQLAEDAED